MRLLTQRTWQFHILRKYLRVVGMVLAPLLAQTTPSYG